MFKGLTFQIKTAPILDQWLVADRLNQQIELQLLHDFTQPGSQIQTILNQVQTNSFDIRMIHSPLHAGEDLELANLEDESVFALAKKTCELGQVLSDYYQRPMPIVFHYGGACPKVEDSSAKMAYFYDRVQQLYRAYPGVCFYLENVTVIGLRQKADQIERRYRNADPFTAPNMVRELQQRFNDPERFKSVLDTCHALMTVRLFQAIGLEMTLEEFFQANRGVCGLIHLTNCTHFGFGKDHGTPFTDQDFVLVKELLGWYQRLGYDCPLTLEINETDYLTYDNYQVSEQTVLTVVDFLTLNQKI